MSDYQDDDVFYPTEEGVELIMRIDEMFRTTDYTVERIAWEVGLDDPTLVQILYVIGNSTGIIDALREDEHID